MLAKHFAAGLNALGVGYADFARDLSEYTGGNYSRQRVYEWATGARPVSRVADMFMRQKLTEAEKTS